MLICAVIRNIFQSPSECVWVSTSCCSGWSSHHGWNYIKLLITESAVDVLSQRHHTRSQLTDFNMFIFGLSLFTFAALCDTVVYVGHTVCGFSMI